MNLKNNTLYILDSYLNKHYINLHSSEKMHQIYFNDREILCLYGVGIDPFNESVRIRVLGNFHPKQIFSYSNLIRPVIKFLHFFECVFIKYARRRIIWSSQVLPIFLVRLIECKNCCLSYCPIIRY